MSRFLVKDICDTTEKKRYSYMFYKIRIQCLAIIYIFFHDYSSVLDNHSVLHVITVILSSTFIAAIRNIFNDLVAKKTLPAYKYEAGYVISFLFFSLTLLYVQIYLLLPKLRW